MEDKIKLTIHAAGIGERLPIPLAGQSVKAGFPSPAQDYMEGEIASTKYSYVIVRQPFMSAYQATA